LKKGKEAPDSPTLVRPSPKHVAVIIAFVTVALSNGWHLPIIQGYAWIQMFKVYSEKVSTGEALEIIFSGKEPCCICDFVNSCKTENEKAWNQWHSQKMILLLKMDPGTLLLSLATGQETMVEYQRYHPLRFEDKEAPPPKHLLG
jgi:hypothetical protein